MDEASAQGDAGDTVYAGRGGLKLRHALDAFVIDVRGLVCADFGCNVGGFTDCLLRAGAERVYAVDTGYGALAWRLRNDPRVVVMERTNALHAPAPRRSTRAGHEAMETGVDLVAIDMGWTPQRLAIPAALGWLRDREQGRIITLIKPHYEAEKAGMGDRLRAGVLDEEAALAIVKRVLEEAPTFGGTPLAVTRSPILGGAGKRSQGAAGNAEWLALLRGG